MSNDVTYIRFPSFVIINIQQCEVSRVSCFLLQYYEMSYGLNIEMHKQVSTVTRQDPF